MAAQAIRSNEPLIYQYVVPPLDVKAWACPTSHFILSLYGLSGTRQD